MEPKSWRPILYGAVLGIVVLTIALLPPVIAQQVSLAAPLPVPLFALAVILGPIAAIVIIISLFCAALVVLGRRPSFAKWTLILAFVLGSLSALAIWMSWDYGLRYQGRNHTIIVSLFNVIGFGLAIGLAELGRRSGKWWVQYSAFLVLWATVVWCAVPYLGELP